MALDMPGNDGSGMYNMDLCIAGLVFTGAASIVAFAAGKVAAPG